MSSRSRFFCISICVLSACTHPTSAPDSGGAPPSEQGGDAGAQGCTADVQCSPGSTCQLTTGRCEVAGCLSSGCPSGFRCDFQSRECVVTQGGPHRLYQGVTLAGHAIDSAFNVRDATGRGAFGRFELLTAESSGRYVYVVDSAVVLRVEVSTGRVETLSGIGWPGEVDGPADVTQFETNFYQNGGLALTADERNFVFTSPHAIRSVDTVTGEARTIARPSGRNLRSLDIGRTSGDLYVIDWLPTMMDVLSTDGGTQSRPLWYPDGGGGPIGYLAVDESRGVAYGLDRNRKSGAFYRWSLDGGAIEWLNHEATGARDPQYTSDGPVSRLEMANPAGLSIDHDGFVYIGAGDGRTFRRFDPDREIVESLCSVKSDAGTDLFEWCVGDGVRNKVFQTWPAILSFDKAGNGFFGYTVQQRLVMLRRLE